MPPGRGDAHAVLLHDPERPRARPRDRGETPSPLALGRAREPLLLPGALVHEPDPLLARGAARRRVPRARRLRSRLPHRGRPPVGRLGARVILNPDVVLFANPAAKAVCAADCVAATAGFPRSELFWCAGCQGSIYPMTGHVAAHVGGVQASTLLIQRMTTKMHRELLMWTGAGESGLCGYYPQPSWTRRTTSCRWSTRSPTRQGSPASAASPSAAPPMIWGAGKEFPVQGEDFAYQIFRKRNCCAERSPSRCRSSFAVALVALAALALLTPALAQVPGSAALPAPSDIEALPGGTRTQQRGVPTPRCRRTAGESARDRCHAFDQRRARTRARSGSDLRAIPPHAR